MIDYLIIVILSFMPFPAYLLGMKHGERKYRFRGVPKARNPIPPPPKNAKRYD